jgi:hypothetical protein
LAEIVCQCRLPLSARPRSDWRDLMAHHGVAVVVPRCLSLFELGITVEVFALHRPDLANDWSRSRCAVPQFQERDIAPRNCNGTVVLPAGGESDSTAAPSAKLLVVRR